jgi:hypothetical protein
VKSIPVAFGKESFEVLFCGGNGRTIAQPPALGKAVDVSIDGKGRDTKGLGHHNARRFVPHSWECFEGLEAVGNSPVMLTD